MSCPRRRVPWIFVAMSISVLAMPPSDVFAASKVVKAGLDPIDINCMTNPSSIYDCYDDAGKSVSCTSVFGTVTDFLTGGAIAAQAKNCVSTCSDQLLRATTLTDAAKLCLRCIAYAQDPKLTIQTFVINALQTGGALYACTKAGYSSLKQTFCAKEPRGCCEKKDLPEPAGCDFVEETCDTGPSTVTYTYGNCYCVVNGAVTQPVQNQTPTSCDAECKKQGGSIDKSQCIGRLTPVTGEKPPTPTVNALCFSLEQCTSPDYGGSPDRFLADKGGCPPGQGYCLAPEPVIQLSSPVFNQFTVKGLRGYILLMFRYLLSIVMIAAAVVFVWAGFRYILASSAGDVQVAKDHMVNATIGLLLTFGAVMLLRTLNPATTQLNSLPVYLLNKQEFTQFKYCSQFKPGSDGKEKKFADAGVAPNFTPYDQAKFTVSAADARCGADYYVDGTAGQTCQGSKCTSGKACISCEGASKDLPECGGNSVGSVCAAAAFVGNYQWNDDSAPQKIMMLPVCNSIQPGSGPLAWSFVDNGIPQSAVFPATMVAQKRSTGSGSYLFEAQLTDFSGGKTSSFVDKFRDLCKDHGGLRGVVLGVQYNDPLVSLRTAGRTWDQIKGSYTGGMLVPLPLQPAYKLYQLTQILPANDMLIVTKRDCGNNGKTRYFGYADGSKTSFDITDAKAAFFCAGFYDPTMEITRDSVGLAYQKKYLTGANQPYWTPEELDAAAKGDKPISCDFALSGANAPPDPGTFLNGCCTKDTKPGDITENGDFCPLK